MFTFCLGMAAGYGFRGAINKYGKVALDYVKAKFGY